MKILYSVGALAALCAAACSESQTPAAGPAPVRRAPAVAASPAAAPATTPASAPAATPQPPTGRNYSIQLGPWGLASFSLTEPFINILHASRTAWSDDGEWTTSRLQEAGYIDAATGLLSGNPSAISIQTGAYMTGGESALYAGDWIIEWDTAAGPGAADIAVSGLVTLRDATSPGRLEFSVAPDEPGFWGMRIAVRRLDAPLTRLALYRAENAAAYKADQLLNPRFRDALSRYDIYRNMDWMRAARGDIRRADELAARNKVFFGDLIVAGSDEPVTPTRAMPLHASVRAAVESQTSIWHVAPLTLGVPAAFDLAGLRWEPIDNRGVLDAEARMILDSPEWDRHADHFVAALIDEGYPADRMIYTTVGNEVWNFAPPFARTTTYAAHIGRAFPAAGFDVRIGYGVLSARWASAVRAALVRAGRSEQPVTFVIESWTATPNATSEALQAAQDWFVEQGDDWAEWSTRFGLSITSYWGFNPVWTQFFSNPGISSNFAPSPAENEALAAQWTAFLNEVGDAEAARQFADFMIGGPDTVVGTAPALIADWRRHQERAAAFGVGLIGAYEGGTHLQPAAFMDGDERLLAFYDSFVHGPDGVRVNTAVNDALIAAFPGVILSDYAFGNRFPNRQDPWHDGTYDEPSPMRTQSWARYYRSDENS